MYLHNINCTFLKFSLKRVPPSYGICVYKLFMPDTTKYIQLFGRHIKTHNWACVIFWAKSKLTQIFASLYWEGFVWTNLQKILVLPKYIKQKGVHLLGPPFNLSNKQKFLSSLLAQEICNVPNILIKSDN